MSIRYCLGGAALLLLAGCGEPQVELHEPGDYSGTPDPLLEISGTEAFNDKLRDRFMMVQTDR